MTFDIKTLTVGQAVAISPASCHGTRYYTGYTVKAISTGRTRITVVRDADGFERVFTDKGREVGASRDWSDTLHTNVAEVVAQAEYDAALQALAHEVNNIGANINVGHRPGLDRVEQALAEASDRIAAARTKLAALKIRAAA